MDLKKNLTYLNTQVSVPYTQWYSGTHSVLKSLLEEFRVPYVNGAGNQTQVSYMQGKYPTR